MRPLVIRDGKGLTELEFVLAMLVELHVVEWTMVRPFILQFRTLDVNGDARLGHEDLDLYKTHSEEELNEMRRKAGDDRHRSQSHACGPMHAHTHIRRPQP